MRSQQERERRVVELRRLVQAARYEVDADRLARAMVRASRKKLLRQLDVKPGC
ncbi:MAG: hypothetical protein ACJ79H_10990 [Myxococcales bacterium]